MEEKKFLITITKKLIHNLEIRLEQLEALRNRDLDKEILDTLNDLRKYRKKLKEIENGE